MRAVSAITLLAVMAIVVVVVTLVRDSQAGTVAGQTCPPDVTRVNLTLPGDAAQVKLRILNGSRTAGAADRVSEELKNRGFQMQPPAESRSKVATVAVVRYGPKTVGAAQWIRAHFLDEAEPQFSAARTTDVIDIVIGDRYRELATRTEVHQSLAQLGGPDLPPGTCADPTTR